MATFPITEDKDGNISIIIDNVVPATHTKFKPGDKVRILVNRDDIGDPTLEGQIATYLEDTGREDDNDTCVHRVEMEDGDEWYYDDGEIELVLEDTPTKSEISVGDIVMVEEAFYQRYPDRKPLAPLARVVEDDRGDGFYKVNFLEVEEGSVDWLFCRAEHLTVVAQAQTVADVTGKLEFEEGDRVIVDAKWASESIGYNDDLTAQVIRTDPTCEMGLPYRVQFNDGTQLWCGIRHVKAELDAALRSEPPAPTREGTMSRLKFKVGESVLMKVAPSSTAKKARIVRVDESDKALPYFVSFDGGERWCRTSQLQKLPKEMKPDDKLSKDKIAPAPDALEKLRDTKFEHVPEEMKSLNNNYPGCLVVRTFLTGGGTLPFDVILTLKIIQDKLTFGELSIEEIEAKMAWWAQSNVEVR